MMLGFNQLSNQHGIAGEICSDVAQPPLVLHELQGGLHHAGAIVCGANAAASSTFLEPGQGHMTMTLRNIICTYSYIYCRVKVAFIS